MPNGVILNYNIRVARLDGTVVLDTTVPQTQDPITIEVTGLSKSLANCINLMLLWLPSTVPEIRYIVTVNASTSAGIGDSAQIIMYSSEGSKSELV